MYEILDSGTSDRRLTVPPAQVWVIATLEIIVHQAAGRHIRCSPGLNRSKTRPSDRGSRSLPAYGCGNVAASRSGRTCVW